MIGRIAAPVLAALFATVHGVTPVQKVIELLEKLEAKVEEEGKKEAAAYDKYACFCKEQVDEKQYNIEKSTEKIEKLDAEIEKLGSEISDLDKEIGELAQKITDLEKESADAQQIRDTEHADYLVKAADAANARDSCDRAIQALKESKGGMEGKTELNSMALVQVRAVATAALALSSSVSHHASEKEVAGLRMLTAVTQQPNQYKYHSNAIIATIEDLRQRFDNIKQDLDQNEFGLNAAHDKKQLGLKNEIKFAEKDKAEKSELADAKRETKEAREGDRTEEKADKKSDQEFQAVLTDECQEKATLWDQRSSTRSQELTAISEAMEALKTGVAPNYKANKKLVGLQLSKAKPQAVAQSFLQTAVVHRHSASASSRSASTGESKVAERAHDLLFNAGMKLRSAVLAATALRVTVSEDHFVKVRSIIKDLVQRLEDEASEEATQKSICDRDMKAAIEKRDAEQNKIEDNKAKIASKEAEVAQLKQDIADLSQAIAENIKALKEAQALRDEENRENTKTILEAGEGKQAVNLALQVLKTFYEGAAFVQYVPPNSDREGLTVSDRAPEVFDADYKGSQDASKGIIGMLEVILQDFDRTVITVTDQEDTAMSAFIDFKSKNEADTELKQQTVETKEGEISTLEDELVGHEGDLKEATENKKEAEKELEVLHSMCVAAEETYEERMAKRKQEIEALKEAHDILENWNK